jgi:hypothetical protein
MITRPAPDLPATPFGAILSGGPGRNCGDAPGYQTCRAERAGTRPQTNFRESPRMRRSALLSLMLPVLLLAGGAFAQSIKIEPESIDLGRMKQMESRTTTVKVTNVGGGLLKIDEVHADCGCTVPEMAVKELQPGASTTMTVTFDSKQFNGELHKMVRIRSNDPARPNLELPLTVFVKAMLIVDPPAERIGFSRALAGQPETKSVTFTAPEQELRLQVGKSEKGAFDFKVTHGVDGDPHKALLEITRPARLEPGVYQDMVRVTTNVSDRPTVDIEIRASVTKELVTAPEIVNFRYQPGFKQEVTIAAASPPLNFKVTRAEIDLPEIKVQVDEVVPNQTTKVRLTGGPIPATDPRAVKTQGHISGTLKIYTNLKSVPVIEVPVSYMIRM